jgi:predicted lipid-binding transport protein (Tim44 family)
VVTSIIIFAMIAAFVGFRLYAVLGRRTGHEQTVAKPVETPAVPAGARNAPERPPQVADSGERPVAPEAEQGIRAIATADPGFDAVRFLAGAQAAYRLVLEAFWRGDVAAIADLSDERVTASFRQAIEERQAAGHVVENRLIGVERAVIANARLDGREAFVTIRFDADIASLTRDAAGEAIAGSLSDAVQAHDLWTFSRTVKSSDPNWLLVETDEAA